MHKLTVIIMPYLNPLSEGFHLVESQLLLLQTCKLIQMNADEWMDE